MGTVKCEFGPRDEKIWGKPWAGRLYLGMDGDWKIEFVDGVAFDGTIKDGGTLLIQAAQGEVLKIGQKNKQEGRSQTAIAIVQDDFSLEFVEFREAMQYLREAQGGRSQKPKDEGKEDWVAVGRVRTRSGILMTTDPMTVRDAEIDLTGGITAAAEIQSKCGMEDGVGVITGGEKKEEIVSVVSVPEEVVRRGYATVKVMYEEGRGRIRKIMVDFES